MSQVANDDLTQKYPKEVFLRTANRAVLPILRLPDRNVAFWQHGDADVAILRKLYFYKDLRFITRPIMFTENNIFSGQKKENGRTIYPKYLPEKNLELSELTQAGDWHRFCLKTQ